MVLNDARQRRIPAGSRRSPGHLPARLPWSPSVPAEPPFEWQGIGRGNSGRPTGAGRRPEVALAGRVPCAAGCRRVRSDRRSRRAGALGVRGHRRSSPGCCPGCSARAPASWRRPCRTRVSRDPPIPLFRRWCAPRGSRRRSWPRCRPFTIAGEPYGPVGHWLPPVVAAVAGAVLMLFLPTTGGRAARGSRPAEEGRAPDEGVAAVRSGRRSPTRRLGNRRSAGPGGSTR